MKPLDVLDFWFGERVWPQWFVRSDAFDAEVRERLGVAHEDAASGRLDDWMQEPRPCLALVILLDQVPRNVHRGTVRAFASDPKALATARLAVERGYDAGFTADERVFLYLPFEHAEDLDAQRRSVELFRERIGPGNYLDYALRHEEIIVRFGRFPHRNAILGRRSTEEEVEFLKQPGSGF
ncbi:DUF924 family protein [Arenibaculum sp.]|jgi:uncharacterized protein (DUF924 family)|uniref:DUF924 family protein n=1 Tax=Arenibaculum sp. TaxID=2865862 RepID=UPI002E1397D7|nr:DUF924 family protein [Arenibaculum sp.]